MDASQTTSRISRLRVIQMLTTRPQ
jgi:hypothetical protein